MFVNKKHDDSKRALATLKTYRAALPSYLQMAEPYGSVEWVIAEKINYIFCLVLFATPKRRLS